MKYFFAVYTKENRNTGKKYSYTACISESENLAKTIMKSNTGNVILLSFNLCATQAKAKEIMRNNNQAFRENGECYL